MYIYVRTNMCLGEQADKSSCSGKVARRLLGARWSSYREPGAL